MRIVFLIMSIVAINVAMLLFSCGSYDANGVCIPESNVWTFLMNPQTTTSSSLWELLFGSTYGLAALAGSLLIVGSFFFKSDTPLFLGMALSLVYPVNSWIKLFQHAASMSAFGDETSRTIVAVILISPILVAYLFSLLDWARGR